MQTVIDGVLANYELFGKGNKGSIVILHGWGRNIDDWKSVAVFLSIAYQVYTLDLPGFGATFLPENVVMGTSDYASFVEKFIKKIELKKPILVGHSLGGRIGIILGTRDNLLSKLVLVDAAGIEERSFLVNLKILLAKIAKLFLPGHLQSVIRDRIGLADYKTSRQMQNVLKKVVSENLRSYLVKIMVPTLIVWGEKDSIQPVELAKIMRKEIPRAKLRIVWEAGHHPHLEKPQDFQEILEEELFQ